MNFIKLSDLYLNPDQLLYVEEDSSGSLIAFFAQDVRKEVHGRNAEALRKWLDENSSLQVFAAESSTDSPINEILKDLNKRMTERNRRTTEVDNAQQPDSPSGSGLAE